MSLLSTSPLVCVRSWAIVIRSPYGKSPGSQRSTVSVVLSRCSCASRSTTAPVQILLTLSSRIRASGVIGAPVATSASPAAPTHDPLPLPTYAVAPGAIRSEPVVSLSRIRRPTTGRSAGRRQCRRREEVAGDARGSSKSARPRPA